jgi:hypothetical protein
MMIDGARFIDTDPGLFRERTASLYRRQSQSKDFIDAIVAMGAD